MNESAKKLLLGYLPYAIGAVLVVQFFALSAWQIDRGLDKRAEKAAFDTQTGFATFFDGLEVRSFQKLKADGRFDAGHQFLLENIIINSRYGYYVLPILEGPRFTGRLDAKADRKRGVLDVLGVWWEDGVRPTKNRRAALERELTRLAGFVGTPDVRYASR